MLFPKSIILYSITPTSKQLLLLYVLINCHMIGYMALLSNYFEIKFRKQFSGSIHVDKVVGWNSLILYSAFISIVV